MNQVMNQQVNQGLDQCIIQFKKLIIEQYMKQ